jgi:hypothetical protein
MPKKVEVSGQYSLAVSMCYELKENEQSKEFDKMADHFLNFMMDNFDTELTVMGAKIALSTYKLPMKPSKLKSFNKFHEKFGKYVVASMEG